MHQVYVLKIRQFAVVLVTLHVMSDPEPLDITEFCVLGNVEKMKHECSARNFQGSES
jgi:hypothetical protein